MSTARTVIRNTTALLVAEVVSKAVSILYVAVLARYVRVDGMGAISTAQAISATLVVVVGFGFNQLIVRDIAADPNKAGSLLGNVQFLRIVLTLAYAIFVWLAVRDAHYSPELATVIYLYALNAALSSLVDTVLSVFQAFEQMQYIMVLRLLRDGLNVALSLLAIYLRYSLVVIVAVSVVATVAQLIAAYLLARRNFALGRSRLDLALCKRLFVAAIPFAVILVYPLATYAFNTVVLSTHASIAEVGAFGAASNLITILMLIPTLFMRAMFPVFARFSGTAKDSLKEAYSRSFNYLLIIGLAISIGTFVTGGRVIRLIYGAGFEQAVPAIQILAWMPFFSFVGYVNGNFLIATGREKFFMLTEGGFSALTAVLGYVLTVRFGYLGSCVAILVPTVITFFFYSILCHRMIKLALPLKITALTTLAGLAMAACTYLALQRQVNLFAVVLIVAPITYGLALYGLRVLSVEDIALMKQAIRLPERNQAHG